MIFLAKLASFMCFSTLLLRLTLKNKYFELQISDYEIVENLPKWAKIPNLDRQKIADLLMKMASNKKMQENKPTLKFNFTIEKR